LKGVRSARIACVAGARAISLPAESPSRAARKADVMAQISARILPPPWAEPGEESWAGWQSSPFSALPCPPSRRERAASIFPLGSVPPTSRLPACPRERLTPRGARMALMI
jgi:hypothetical protein